MAGGDFGTTFDIERQADGSWRLVVYLPLHLMGALTGAAGTGVSVRTGQGLSGTINGSNRVFTFQDDAAVAESPYGAKAAVFSDNIRVPSNQYTIVTSTLTFNAGSVYIPNTELVADYRV